MVEEKTEEEQLESVNVDNFLKGTTFKKKNGAEIGGRREVLMGGRTARSWADGNDPTEERGDAGERAEDAGACA